MNEVVRLRSEELEVEIWTLGARLNGVWLQGTGPLVEGALDENDARERKVYNGAVVGPVANRIAGAAAEIDGKVCAFDANERGRTTLHSGKTGTHLKNWAILTRDDGGVSLKLDLADGDGGFPGNRQLRAHFTVEGADLTIRFEAETDAPTWINLALHPYWTLGLNGRANQKISVDADRYLPVDEFQIPTGELADVTSSPFDLRSIGEPSHKIDHNYCLNGDANPTVVLEGDTGIRMSIVTDAPGLQVFTGKPNGIALEPQHWPDAMHHRHFPSIELRPGQSYSQTSTYHFSRR